MRSGRSGRRLQRMLSSRSRTRSPTTTWYARPTTGRCHRRAHVPTFQRDAWNNEMSNDACIFCRIVANQATANILYRDQQVTAFRDMRPAGPTHLLIVPNKHIDSLNQLKDEDEGL